MKSKPGEKPIFILASAGILAGLTVAYLHGIKKPAEPPVYTPASNPFAQGIYAQGMVESYLTNGENINIYPEVSGTVTKILVSEGQHVQAGTTLVQLDDSIQSATADQLTAQADAALALLEELNALPRPETLHVAEAQADAAMAALKNVQDQLSKVQRAHRLNPRAVSQGDLDNARNAVEVARANHAVTLKQYELTKAGAWSYDIRNQAHQYDALSRQAVAATALLGKYTLSAPVDGTVMAIRTAVGSFVSPQGVYGTYTQGLNPIVIMGGSESFLQVRTYVDEILIHRLPDPRQMSGQMFIRGTDKKVPLEFVRVQPYVTPKIELSNQRQERVDVRVLPVLFKFEKPKDLEIYPGQLVDVYLEGKQLAQLPGTTPSPKAAK